MNDKITNILKTVANLHLSAFQHKRLASQIASLAYPRELVVASIREGVAGLLLRHLAAAETLNALTEDISRPLQDSCYRIARLNIQLMHAMRDLLPSLENNSLRVVLLQGMPLQYDLYRDPSIRPMSDIDMWLMPEDFASMSALLGQHGYRQDPLYPGTFSNGRIKLDVHTNLLWADRIRSRKWLLQVAPVQIFDRSVPFEVEGMAAYRLDPHDEVLYLCTHVMKHHAERLIWLLDLHLLTKNWSDSQWPALFARSRTTGLERQLAYAFTLVRDVLGKQLPAPLSDFIQQQRYGSLEHWLLKKRRQKGALPPWAVLVWFTAGKPWRQRIPMMCEMLFPRAAVLRQVFPEQSDRGTANLYLMRIGQLLNLRR